MFKWRLFLFMMCCALIVPLAAPALADGVAKIGSTEYATLQAAIDACPTNGTETTITMIADYTGATISKPSTQTATGIITTGQNIILDLAGHTIQTSLDTDGNSYWTAHVLYVNGGTLTIKDSASDGKIINTNTSSYPCTRVVLVTNSAKFTMNGGTIEAKSGEGMRIDGGATVALNSGATVLASDTSNGNATGWDNTKVAIEFRGNSTTTIDGAEIKSVGQAALFSDQTTDKILIKSGVFTGNSGYGVFYGSAAQNTITITGGYFNSDPTDYIDATAYRVVVQEGEYAGYYKVEEIVPTNVTVRTLEELKTAASSATTTTPVAIALGADIVIANADITLGSTSTLTIPSGYKLSVISGGIFRNDGKTINNGTLSVSVGGFFSHIMKVEGSGTFTGYPRTNGIYKITYPMDLQWLAYLNKSSTAVTSAALANDITMPSDVNFDPIPYFRGTFNGAGHSISNLTLSSTSGNLGLFDQLGDSSINAHTYVKNLEINETLSTVTARCGGLAATTCGYVHITGVTMNGSMTASGATYYFAPFVGYAFNNGAHLYIADSETNMTVTANSGANISPIIGSTGNGQSFTIGVYNFKNTGVISATAANNSIGYVAGYSMGKDSSAPISIDVINYDNSGSITNSYGTWNDIGTGANYLCCNSGANWGANIFTTTYIATSNKAYYNSYEDKYQINQTSTTGISLNQTALKIFRAGDLAELQASLTPNGATDTVTWTSSNTAVATVYDGLITAVAPGTAIITATANGHSVSCTVTICQPVTITAKDQNIVYGETISQTLNDVIVTGLDNGVTLTDITITPSTNAVTNNGVVTPSNAVLKSGNDDVSSLYEVIYVTGKLVITAADAAAVTVTPSITALPDGTANQEYSANITFTVTPSGLEQTISVEGLPAGLAFSDGKITGTPTESGTFTVKFNVTVTDNSGGTTTQTVTLSLVINAAASGGGVIIDDNGGMTVSETETTDFSDLIASLSADNKLDSITSVTINDTSSLTTIQGLDKLTSLKSLDVVGNNTVTNVDLSSSESLTSVNLQNCSSLTEVKAENCTNLQKLDCSGGSVEKISLQGCDSLTDLSCQNNNLEELDVSECPNLTSLDCSANNIGNLNVEGCENLVSLNCGANSLSDLSSITSCRRLEVLYCYSNNLTELNVQNSERLYILVCDDNSLNTLNVEQNKKLKRLDCQNNAMPVLDITSAVFQELQRLKCYGQNLSGLSVTQSGGTYSFNLMSYMQSGEFTEAAADVNNSNDDLNNFKSSSSVDNVSGIKAYDADGNAIEVTSYESGVISFASKPSKIVYDYDTGYNNTKMDVTISEKTKRSGGVESETETSSGGGGGGGGCDVGLGIFSALIILAGFLSIKFLGIRGIKNKIFILILIFVPMLSSVASADVEINSTNFPDANFRAYLVASADTDGDGTLTDAEIAAVTYIDVNTMDISNLKGIENFVELIELYCYANNLTALDVSSNKKLQILECDKNKLTSLNLSQNSALAEFECELNCIRTLDLSSNTELYYVKCYNQIISDVDVTSSDKIFYVDLSDYVGTENLAKIVSSEITGENSSGDVIYSVSYNETSGVVGFSEYPYEVTYKYETGYYESANKEMTMDVTLITSGDVSTVEKVVKSSGGGGGSSGCATVNAEILILFAAFAIVINLYLRKRAAK